MPNLDGTGPQGKGPQTGRGLGKCNKENKSVNVENVQRPGRCEGRGNRNRRNTI